MSNIEQLNSELENLNSELRKLTNSAMTDLAEKKITITEFQTKLAEGKTLQKQIHSLLDELSNSLAEQSHKNHQQIMAAVKATNHAYARI